VLLLTEPAPPQSREDAADRRTFMDGHPQKTQELAIKHDPDTERRLWRRHKDSSGGVGVTGSHSAA